MAWNGLVKKLKNGFRKAVFIGTAFAVLGSASCKLPVPIPTRNDPPEIISAPVGQIYEEQPYMYDVDAIDSEGDILTYSLNQAPDWLLIDSATGVITGTAPLVDSDTDHDIIVSVGDGVNSVTQQYTLTVKDISEPPPDYVDISAKLEDCENDGTGRQGIIKVYDARDNSFLSQHSVNGDFSFTLEKLVSELLGGIIVQAGMTDTLGNLLSYVRTIRLSSGDHNPITNPKGNPAIRVVPYDNPNDSYDDGLIGGIITSEQFRTHMGETNLRPDIQFHGLIKFDFELMKEVDGGIEIMHENNRNNSETGESYGIFTSSDAQNFENKIKDINDIGNYLKEYFEKNGNIPVQNDRWLVDNNQPYVKHYDIKYLPAPTVIPYQGWVVIEPDDFLGGAVVGDTEFFGTGAPGYIGAVRIRLQDKSDSVFEHESAHGLIPYLYHASATLPSINSNLTVGATAGDYLPNSPPIFPGPVDKKAARITNEETFLVKEELNDIIALNFLNNQ